ncbi:hypothetical protein [Pricia antarctica]|uniref:hypothetical protein n=1 Tax=Pricia antarctica TaxID=641691 RepID=UPI0011137A75|nr:hypothetical protein [Pricia antarctica]
MRTKAMGLLSGERSMKVWNLPSIPKAKKVYQEDVKALRQNGWSLMGLYKSFVAQNKKDEAKIIKDEFDKAWKDADMEISKSVL